MACVQRSFPKERVPLSRLAGTVVISGGKGGAKDETIQQFELKLVLMTRNILLSVLLSFLLFTHAIADPDASINGGWTSSSGATISICYAGNPDTFIIDVYKGQQKTASYEAHWMQGFRVQFYYFSGKDKIYGVYDPDQNQISLKNPETNWHATWSR